MKPQLFMSLTCGEKGTKDLVKRLRGNNVKLNKVYNIVGSFFGSSQRLRMCLSQSGLLRNLCGRISRDQADHADVNKTLAVFKEIQRNDPEFTY